MGKIIKSVDGKLYRVESFEEVTPEELANEVAHLQSRLNELQALLSQQPAPSVPAPAPQTPAAPDQVQPQTPAPQLPPEQQPAQQPPIDPNAAPAPVNLQ